LLMKKNAGKKKMGKTMFGRGAAEGTAKSRGTNLSSRKPQKKTVNTGDKGGKTQ